MLRSVKPSVDRKTYMKKTFDDIVRILTIMQEGCNAIGLKCVFTHSRLIFKPCKSRPVEYNINNAKQEENISYTKVERLIWY